MTLFWFLWGVLLGSVVTAWVGWAWRHRYRWQCPGCHFRVAGSNRAVVDYVILEHREAHQ